jgi:hypothetical protein
MCNSQSKNCIPYLIDNKNKEKIVIHDSCIDDTLKIIYRVEVIFEQSLTDTIKPMVVKSVHLIDMNIRSLNSPHIKVSLSNLTPIESPLQQYIWDLCSAKFAYWYRFQPYKRRILSLKSKISLCFLQDKSRQKRNRNHQNIASTDGYRNSIK